MGAAKFLGVASQPPIVSRVATAGGGVKSGLATRSKRSLDDLEVSSVAFSDDSVYRSSGRNARDPSGHAAPLYRPPALHRAHKSVLVLRARFHRRYVSFTLAVERNFWLSARALPHVMYWVAASLLMWLAPELTSMACEHLWVWVAVTWPTLSALYLLLLVRSDDLVRESRVMPLDIDKVLRYWVVFTAAQCLQALTEYVPFASAIVESIAPPILRTIIFFAVVWMHLPGPGSGLHVS